VTFAKAEGGNKNGGLAGREINPHRHTFLWATKEGYIHIKLKLNGKTTWQQFSFQRRRNQQQAE